MTYSCGIFEVLDGDTESDASRDQSSVVSETPRLSSGSPPAYFSSPESSKDDLCTAQMRKLKHVLQKADIRAHHNLLEIGSGWGSFAILAVQTTGCNVDTITLSRQQQEFARQRISKLGLEDKIRVHLMDYRNMPPEWAKKFDRVVSIEMIEAVGKEFLETYFKVVDWALKPVGGVAVIQSITIPEARK
jgi:cyclopropane-fatty-acyl-phospholipid synthase